MEDILSEMKQLGAVIIDPAELPSQGKISEHEFEVMLYEFKADLNACLGRLGRKVQVRSLQEVIEINNRARDLEMPWFGQDILLKAQEKGPRTEPACLAALEACRRLSRNEGDRRRGGKAQPRRAADVNHRSRSRDRPGP